MRWNQIEAKWAVMARRIRADVPYRFHDDGMVARDDGMVAMDRTMLKEPLVSMAAQEPAAGAAVGAQDRKPVSAT